MTRLTPARVRRVGVTVALLAATLALGGCWNPFVPKILGRGISTPPPVPNSAQNVLRLLEWCYNNRSYSEYRELFTADYRFAFAARDSNGDKYRTDPWSRDDELPSTQKLFEGGDANQPAASSITLILDKTFNVQNDTRDSSKYDPERRKSITTRVNLTITTVDGASTNVNGSVTFFLVSGDIADIPSDLGFGPDANRWYIERWEDNTYAPNGVASLLATGPPGASAAARGATAARPAGARGSDVTLSWGAVKAWYR